MTETEIFDIDGISLRVSRDHRFGTDAVQLAGFARVKPTHRVCDLCTGCGIVAVLMHKNYRPKIIFALDISENAVALLRETVEENGLSTLFPLRQDLRELRFDGDFRRESMDIVTANPPYFKAGSGVERLSPEQAAARHELLCDIGEVVGAAAVLLKYGGSVKLCHIPERLAEVMAALGAHGLEPKELVFLCKAGGREPWLFLISAKKGGRPGLRVSFREILL